MVEARFKFSDDLRSLVFVRFLTGLAAKLMVEISSA
jgi:hypothetical protein